MAARLVRNQMSPSVISFGCAGPEISAPSVANKGPASVDAFRIGKQGALGSAPKKMIGEHKLGAEIGYRNVSDQFSSNLIWQQLATARVLKCADFRRESPSNTIYNILNINEMQIC